MGAFAEFERALIRERQREGIAIAKQRGVYRARKKSLSNAKVAELMERIAGGEQKAVIPPHSLVMGTPGRVLRSIDRLRSHIVDALLYAMNARGYAAGNHRAWRDADLDALGVEADRILAVP